MIISARQKIRILQVN